MENPPGRSEVLWLAAEGGILGGSSAALGRSLRGAARRFRQPVSNDDGQGNIDVDVIVDNKPQADVSSVRVTTLAGTGRTLRGLRGCGVRPQHLT